MSAWTTLYITMTVFDRPKQGVSGNTIVRNLNEVGVAFTALMQDMASPIEMPWSAYMAWMDGASIGEPRLGECASSVRAVLHSLTVSPPVPPFPDRAKNL